MIRLIPTEKTEREIGEFLRRIDDLIAPDAEDIRPIQETIRAAFAFNFSAEQGADQPWAPLALFTMRERRRLGFPMDHPILERTGEYRRSFTAEEHPAHISEWSATAGRWTIDEGSRDYRVGELEDGRWNMPGRPVTIIGQMGESMMSTVLEQLFDQWFEAAE